MSGERFTALLAAARDGDESAWSEIHGELAPAVLGYLRGSGAPDPEDTLRRVLPAGGARPHGFEGDWTQVPRLGVHDRPPPPDRRPPQRRPPAGRPGRRAAEPSHRAGRATPPTRRWRGSARARSPGCSRRCRPTSAPCLLLRIVGDLSIEQVAEALGKRPGAIKQLQRRGLAAVRRTLERKGVTL